MTYTDEKRKKAMEIINKFVIRGKDPLQAHIDDLTKAYERDDRGLFPCIHQKVRFIQA